MYDRQQLPNEPEQQCCNLKPRMDTISIQKCYGLERSVARTATMDGPYEPRYTKQRIYFQHRHTQIFPFQKFKQHAGSHQAQLAFFSCINCTFCKINCNQRKSLDEKIQIVVSNSIKQDSFVCDHHGCFKPQLDITWNMYIRFCWILAKMELNA